MHKYFNVTIAKLVVKTVILKSDFQTSLNKKLVKICCPWNFPGEWLQCILK